MLVGLKEVQRADPPSLILAGLLQSSGEFAEPRAVVYRTECVPVTLIGLLRNLGAAVHIGHATSHSPPPQVVVRAAFVGSVDFENLRVLREGFDAKQVAHRGTGFAVTLQRIAVNAVLDPVAAGAAFEVGRQFSLVVARNLSGNVDTVAQKLQHIRTRKTQHPVLQQQGCQAGERARTEQDVGGPFALETSPVILRRVVAEDFLMQWIQPLGERLESLGPVYGELFLEQLLGSGNILHPGKTVSLAEIAQAFPVHAAA